MKGYGLRPCSEAGDGIRVTFTNFFSCTLAWEVYRSDAIRVTDAG